MPVLSNAERRPRLHVLPFPRASGDELPELRTTPVSVNFCEDWRSTSSIPHAFTANIGNIQAKRPSAATKSPHDFQAVRRGGAEPGRRPPQACRSTSRIYFVTRRPLTRATRSISSTSRRESPTRPPAGQRLRYRPCGAGEPPAALHSAASISIMIGWPC